MKLLDLTAEGLRIPDGTYSFRAVRNGAPHDIVLVTGPPASGKTSFLLAIAALKEAFGPYGSPPDLRRLLGRRLRSDPDKYSSLRRALFDIVNEQAARVAEALGSRGVALRAEVPDLLAPFKQAVAAMLPDLRLTSIRLREGSVALELTRREGQTVALEELSASEEQAVLFALAHGWLNFHHSLLLVDFVGRSLLSRRQAERPCRSTPGGCPPIAFERGLDPGAGRDAPFHGFARNAAHRRSASWANFAVPDAAAPVAAAICLAPCRAGGGSGKGGGHSLALSAR
jgi:hypothetical protein